MAVTYEWAVETTTNVDTGEYEKGEILDVNHFDTFAEAKEHADGPCWAGCEEVLVLVRDTDSDRAWAYMVDGKLPTHFTDAYGRAVAKVPERYHREVAK